MIKHTNIYYHLSNNVGDAINPYLVRKITGGFASWVSLNDERPKYMVCGSILNHSSLNCTVWGAGLAFSSDKIPYHQSIVAVRGNLTAKKIETRDSERAGYCIEYQGAVGDPALLLPRFYNPIAREKKFKLGIIPHYIDMATVCEKLTQTELDSADFKIIDVCQPIEDFIDDLISCESIVSSSLHGLIISDAYSIPSAWVKFSNEIGGDDFKYHDYYSTTDLYDPTFFDLRTNLSTALLKKVVKSKVRLVNSTIPLDDLIDSCPFKKK